MTLNSTGPEAYINGLETICIKIFFLIYTTIHLSSSSEENFRATVSWTKDKRDIIPFQNTALQFIYTTSYCWIVF